MTLHDFKKKYGFEDGMESEALKKVKEAVRRDTSNGEVAFKYNLVFGQAITTPGVDLERASKELDQILKELE